MALVVRIIKDPRWRGDLPWTIVWLGVIGLFLFVWIFKIKPIEGSTSARIAHKLIAAILAAWLVVSTIRGFQCRYTEVNSFRLVIHEGYYGMLWRRQTVAPSQIVEISRYDRQHKGLFMSGTSYGISIRLTDGKAIPVTEEDDKGRVDEIYSSLSEWLANARRQNGQGRPSTDEVG